MCTPMYTTLGIRDLRSDLAAAVRRARSGERTVITDRGDPVAELGPPTAADPDGSRCWSTAARSSNRVGADRAGRPERSRCSREPVSTARSGRSADEPPRPRLNRCAVTVRRSSPPRSARRPVHGLRGGSELY